MKLHRWISHRLQALAIRYPGVFVFVEDALRINQGLPDRVRQRLGLRRLPLAAPAAAADISIDLLPPEVARLIVAARNRLWLEFAAAFILRTALIGLVLIAAAGLVSIITPLPVSLLTLWAIPGALFAWGLLLVLQNRPTEWQSARVIDRRLGLRQRLSTAMEILAKPTQSPAERLQVEDALTVARSIEPGRRLPVEVSPRETRLVAGALSLALVLTLVTTVFDVTLFKPSSAHQELVAKAQKAHEIQNELATDLNPESRPKSLASTVSQLLNKVTGRGGNETVSQLKDAETKLTSEVSDSFKQEQALAQLANNWRDGSATQSVADSLTKGDYNQAANDIEALAEHLQDLSPQAVAEMARGLDQAAKQSQPYDQRLADTMQRASDALTQSQASQQSRSNQSQGSQSRNSLSGSEQTNQARDQLRDLAQQTQQAGESVAARNQLTDALNDIRESREAMSKLMGTPEDGLTPNDQQTPGSQAGSEGGNGLNGQQSSQSGESSAPREGEVRSAQSEQRASSLTPVGGTASQQANAATGDHQTVDVQPPTLGRGQEVQTQNPDPNAEPRIGRGGAAAGSAGITGKITANSDTTAVPWQFKSMIKDYFAHLEARSQ